jgi:broad specificity phosphatase PhoE
MQKPPDRELTIARALSQIGDTLRPGDVLVAIFRHGEKDKDTLTALGVEQVVQAIWQFTGQILVEADRAVDVILTSGLNRTAQAAAVTQKELRLQHVTAEKEPGLNPFPLIDEIWPGNSQASFDEMMEIRTTNDSVAHAREVSRYAQQGSEIVRQMLLRRAKQMVDHDQRTAIGFSHSPWLELAVLDADKTPYGVEEAAAAVYIIRGNDLVLGLTLLAPMKGKRN